jgi:hypothetical protein
MIVTLAMVFSHHCVDTKNSKNGKNRQIAPSHENISKINFNIHSTSAFWIQIGQSDARC